MSRIVLFGATGYTGRLTADALVRRGLRPVLAGRNAASLDELAAELGGGCETAVADVGRPESIRALLSRGDVLVTTVGPFARFGAPAVEAAIDAGATYIDSTGETGFIRDVFQRWSEPAAEQGVALLSAMGYDWVPGNLAGAAALAEAGPRAARVEIGYFLLGSAKGGLSGGTQASAAGALMSPGYGFRNGRISTERTARRVRSFVVDGATRPAFSVGSTEQFSLPRVYPGLRDVDVYLGWFGPLSRPMQAGSLLFSGVRRIPGAARGFEKLTGRFVRGSTGGPDAKARAGTGSHIVARATDSSGAVLSEVRVVGVNGYTFTGEMLAWVADKAARGEVQGRGALGPVEAFGVEGLTKACADAGLTLTFANGVDREPAAPLAA